MGFDLLTILDVTNEKLKTFSKIGIFTRAEVIRMIGIRLALTLDLKKGGLYIHWAEYDEDIEGLILGGEFESRFGVSRNRFDKFWQAFRLTRYPSCITRATQGPLSEVYMMQSKLILIT